MSKICTGIRVGLVPLIHHRSSTVFVCTAVASPLRSLIPTLPCFFFFLIIRHPRRSTLFPYPPLFRSVAPPRPATGTSGRNRYLPASAVPENWTDRKSTRLNSSHLGISYAVFCLKK